MTRSYLKPFLGAALAIQTAYPLYVVAVDDVWTGNTSGAWNDTANWNNAMAGGGNFVIATKDADVAVTFPSQSTISTGLWIENIAVSDGVDTTVSFSGDDSAAGLGIGENLTVGTQFGFGRLSIASGAFSAANVLIGAQDASAIGYYAQSGGTMTVSDGFLVGSAGSGEAVFSGDAAMSAGWFSVGAGDENGSSTATIRDGAAISSYIRVGAFQPGVFNISGGTVEAYAFILGSDAAVQGTVNLSGGTLSAPAITLGDAGTGEINISGGTLHATQAGAFIAASSRLAVTVSDSFTIASDYDITIAQPLAFENAAAAITKTGSGVLTFSSAVAGSIAVAEGGGMVLAPSASTATAGENTAVFDSGTLKTFYRYDPENDDSYVWTGDGGNGNYWTSDAHNNWMLNGSTHPSSAPGASTDAVRIPYGATVYLSSSGDTTIESLELNGRLQLYGTGRLLTASTGSGTLAISGKGTLSLNPAGTQYVGGTDYSSVMLQPSSGVTIEVRVDLSGLATGATILTLGAGSTVEASQISIPGCSRSVERVKNEDGTYAFKVGDLVGSWLLSLAGVGQIVWDAPQTITGAGDISSEGTLVCAYFHNYGEGKVGTRNPWPWKLWVGDTPFYRYFQGTTALEEPGYISYSYPSGTYDIRNVRQDGIDVSDVPSDCQTLLAGSMKTTAGGELDITIKGLVANRAYLVQIFSVDSSTSGQTAKMRVGGVDMSMAGAGQYIIGRFIASGETQTIHIQAGHADGSGTSATARENAILWRDITGDLSWTGGSSGTWDQTGLGWGDFTSEYNLWTSPAGYAYNAVVDGASLTVDGDVFAGNVTLSGGAQVNVPFGETLAIGSDLTATGAGSFAGEGTVSIGGLVTKSGSGTFTVNAVANEFLITGGEVVQQKSGQASSLDFGSLALYGNDAAIQTGYESAAFTGSSNVTITSVEGGGGNISANGTLTFDFASDTAFVGALSGTEIRKTGEGRMAFLGTVSSTDKVTVSGGTLCIAKPSDLDGVNYDYDASDPDTVIVENGEVVRWDDSTGSGRYLVPLAEDTHINATYEVPVYESANASVLGGRAHIASSKLCLDSNSAETQESLFMAIEFTGEEVSNTRIALDRSDSLSSSSVNQNYRWRVETSSAKPYVYDYSKNTASAPWISVNGQFGGEFDLAPAVLSVPWHWSRVYNGNSSRRIGYGFGASMAFGEIVSFSRQVTAEENTAIVNYLMHKWGAVNTAYKPLGDAAVEVASGAALDMNGIDAAISSLDCSGALQGAANTTVSGDVVFRSGTKIYVDDLSAPVMKVNGSLSGGSRVNIYVKDAETGAYTLASGYAVRLVNGSLVPCAAGFHMILR